MVRREDDETASRRSVEADINGTAIEGEAFEGDDRKRLKMKPFNRCYFGKDSTEGRKNEADAQG